MRRWLCGTCSGPGCGWPSWAPAGSARSWPPRRLAVAPRSPWWRRDPRRSPRPWGPLWGRRPSAGTPAPASTCESMSRWNPFSRTGWRWPGANGSPRTRSSPRSGYARPPGGWRTRACTCSTAWPAPGGGARPPPGGGPAAGLHLQNGVAVDAGLRASQPGVYAVGDCAAFESRRFGRRLRFEHWDVALHAPEVVAANLLGGDEVYDPVPYFWSEQFGRMVQYAGYHGDAEDLLWRGDPAAPTWTACWLTAGRLVALLTVDRPRDLLQGRRLITSGDPGDIGRLADPAIPLKAAVAT